MNIIIEKIPHNHQRYNTVGDWIFNENGDLNIKISDMNNWKYEVLIALHELIETALCKDRGISQESVDKFDMDNPDLDDPGSSPLAPYRLEHFHALNIERLFSEQLGVNWEEYQKTIMDVAERYK